MSKITNSAAEARTKETLCSDGAIIHQHSSPASLTPAPAGAPSGKILLWFLMTPHVLCSCRAEILSYIHPYSIQCHPTETSPVFPPAHRNQSKPELHIQPITNANNSCASLYQLLLSLGLI